MEIVRFLEGVINGNCAGFNGISHDFDKISSGNPRNTRIGHVKLLNLRNWGKNTVPSPFFPLNHPILGVSHFNPYSHYYRNLTQRFDNQILGVYGVAMLTRPMEFIDNQILGVGNIKP
jgi:hypothetical protein